MNGKTPYRRRWLPYVVASLLVAVAFGIRVLLGPIMGDNLPLQLLVLAIASAAWFGGLKPGLLATAISALMAAYLLSPLGDPFRLPGNIERIRLITFVGTGILLSSMGEVMRSALRRAEDGRTAAVAAERKFETTLDSIGKEITERKRTMEALRRSEEELRLLAESLPQLVWRADPDGTIKYYNVRINDYAGAARNPDGSWEWRPMLHPDDVKRTAEAWETSMSTGAMYAVEHRVRMADGSFRWHLSRAFPSRAHDGAIVRWFGTATDIHEQKTAAQRLDEQVQIKTAELRDTVAELEAMSYSIVHDMRAPLRSIIGFSRVLAEEEGPRLSEEGQSIVNRLCAAGGRMDALIRDVLAYTSVSRSDELLEPVDCEALLHEIVTDYPNLFGATIEFHPPFPPVLGNRAWLTQVFSNLLGNAAKFVAPGVTPHIRVHADTFGTMGRYWFEDNGIGIPENVRKRLFNIFQRGHTTAEYPGTGIGLAIVRRAVERMGGRCGVESRIGHGSQFWVELRLVTSTPLDPVQEPIDTTQQTAQS
jgi:PAS domain S-box-containing protein